MKMDYNSNDNKEKINNNTNQYEKQKIDNKYNIGNKSNNIELLFKTVIEDNKSILSKNNNNINNINYIKVNNFLGTINRI